MPLLCQLITVNSNILILFQDKHDWEAERGQGFGRADQLVHERKARILVHVQAPSWILGQQLPFLSRPANDGATDQSMGPVLWGFRWVPMPCLRGGGWRNLRTPSPWLWQAWSLKNSASLLNNVQSGLQTETVQLMQLIWKVLSLYLVIALDLDARRALFHSTNSWTATRWYP